MNLRPTYIRGRLTFWYLFIFGLILAGYVVGACLLQYWQLINQLYHAEVQDMETVQGLLYFTSNRQIALRDDYFNRPQSRLLLERMMEVFDDNGRVLFRNQKLDGNTLGGAPVAGEGVGGFSPRRMKLADGTHVLVISHVHRLAGVRVLIRLAYSTEPLRLQMAELFGILLLVLPVALIAGGFAGYRIAGKALDPLEQMALLTEHITAYRLDERVPIRNPDDEFGHMARVLNQLLERLEDAFKRLSRFASDVSHELRTPLAAMRSVGEVGLQEQRDAVKYRDIIGSMLEEVSKLTVMVDTLLTMAHAESGAIELQRTAFSFSELVFESVAIAEVLAEDKKQTISIEVSQDNQLWADSALLRMAVLNLLDNAIKYSPQGSKIHLSVHGVETEQGPPLFVQLDIMDEGPGIPERARLLIFERFYRLDEARTRETGGVGLGLPIAKWVVEAHGGQIWVEPGSPLGATFSIRLPLAGGPLDQS